MQLKGHTMWDKNNEIAKFIKAQRKKYGITQIDFSIKTGLGLRFVRELEQGKNTLRMDKVQVALNYFGARIGVKENYTNKNF